MIEITAGNGDLLIRVNENELLLGKCHEVMPIGYIEGDQYFNDFDPLVKVTFEKLASVDVMIDQLMFLRNVMKFQLGY